MTLRIKALPPWNQSPACGNRSRLIAGRSRLPPPRPVRSSIPREQRATPLSRLPAPMRSGGIPPPSARPGLRRSLLRVLARKQAEAPNDLAGSKARAPPSSQTACVAPRPLCWVPTLMMSAPPRGRPLAYRPPEPSLVWAVLASLSTAAQNSPTRERRRPASPRPRPGLWSSASRQWGYSSAMPTAQTSQPLVRTLKAPSDACSKPLGSEPPPRLPRPAISMAAEFGWTKTYEGWVLSSFFAGYAATQASRPLPARPIPPPPPQPPPPPHPAAPAPSRCRPCATAHRRLARGPRGRQVRLGRRPLRLVPGHVPHPRSRPRRRASPHRGARVPRPR